MSATTLIFIGGGQAKPAVGAAPTHGFHHRRDHDLPVPGVWRNSHLIPQRVEVIQASVVQDREYQAYQLTDARNRALPVPLSGNEGAQGYATNNKTGVSHLDFCLIQKITLIR